MINKILIANRGEIACRILRSARRLGKATVAIYSEADRDSPHVDMADEAFCVGPAVSVESYLSIERVLAAIRETGADAVHPGYGFLSENASFTDILKKEGITFIGPNAHAITVMGDKIESKKVAEQAGVNVIPGQASALDSEDQVIAAAWEIGYPVMLKASAGGGGKGMRVATNDQEAQSGFGAATREAMASFGDGRIFVEKYIEHPRHIEIQIMADAHGNVVYLGERECSIQRRHQKVIEEAPSPFIDPDTRRSMGAQAVTLAKAVGYVSAGTVEFIVDAHRNYYFLEMNTRLQVEHPVTEMVTGLDLVELMIRVADGEKLPFTQEDIVFKGWAMEGRVYAEDPVRNFLPSVGRLVRYQEPGKSESVRMDSGVREGGEVSVYYDPMMAKLITYGADRNEAIRVMRHALDEFLIEGVRHNIGFLAAIMAHPRFQAGNLSTGFIAEEYGDGFDMADVPHDKPEVIAAVAVTVHQIFQERAASITGHPAAERRQVGTDWVAVFNGEYWPVSMDHFADRYSLKTEKSKLQVRTRWKPGEPLFRCSIGGEEYCLQVRRLNVGYRILHWGAQTDVLVLGPRAAALHPLMPEKKAADTSRFLLSPMPGRVVSVFGSVGQEVEAGEELAVVEAMKMENILIAERDGVIAAVHAQPGDNLAVDAPIIEFE